MVNLSYNTDNNLIKVLQDVSLEVDHKDTVVDLKKQLQEKLNLKSLKFQT